MEIFMRLLINLMVAGIVLAAGKDLPSSFKKCKRSDPDLTKCLITSVTGAIQELKSGLPEFGILSIDPMVLDSLVISQGANTPINLRQTFKNLNVNHITEFTIKKYIADLDNNGLKVTVFSPILELIGDYELDGQVLLLPISGKGKANITLYNLTATHEMIGEPLKKDGEVYWHIKNFIVTMKPKHVHLHFENLFNGDKVFGDTMNKFLNENWKIVFNEMKDGYEETVGRIAKEIGNKILLEVPMNNMFLD